MERILVALDGSEHSEKALDLASDIAGKYGAELILLHVMSDRPLTDAEREMAEVEYLDDLSRASMRRASRAGPIRGFARSACCSTTPAWRTVSGSWWAIG